MGKLLDMFVQTRRGQSSGNMGFFSKHGQETKPRSAAIVVEFSTIDSGNVEAATKAGADGLLFTRDGKNATELESLKKAIEAAKTGNENVVCGVRITNGWDILDREHFEQMKDQGIQYVILPFQAPVRLLALQVKDMELVVTVPMRQEERYADLIRTLTSYSTLAAVDLDFALADTIGIMTIEDSMRYRAVRDAVRFPALLSVTGTINEADAQTLLTLGVQAITVPASDTEVALKKQIKATRDVLEKVHQEEKDN